MSILSDVKTELGIADTNQDTYLLTNFVNPAIRVASGHIRNHKVTTVALIDMVQTYTLTSSLVASPVVASSGVQQLVFDPYYPWAMEYGVDFYMSNKTTLYFTINPGNDSIRLKYNEFFSDATTDTESNIPEQYRPYVKDIAVADYGITQNSKGSGGISGGVVQSKQEDGMSVSYKTNGETQLYKAKSMAIENIRKLSNLGFTNFTYRVV